MEHVPNVETDPNFQLGQALAALKMIRSTVEVAAGKTDVSAPTRALNDISRILQIVL